MKKIKLNRILKKQPSKKKAIGAVFLLALGIVLMPSGFLLSNYIQQRIDEGIKDQVEVPSKHSSAYDEWLSNDYDDAPEIIRTFYLWNLTNPNEYLEGDKPNYEEIGPFVFREFNYKYDVEFSDNKEEVTFKKYSNYVQVGGKKVTEVNITNINPGYLGARETAGGTDTDFIKLSFPMTLSIVKDTFVEEYLATLPGSINNDGNLQRGLGFFDPPYLPPGIGEIDQSLLNPPLNDPVTFNFTTALPAVSVFYEKWANDYYPFTNHWGKFGISTTYMCVDNMTVVEISVGKYVTGQQYGNMLVNKDGSVSHLGVDIDGRSPYNFPGSETDLNISKSKIVQYPGPNPALKYRVNEGGSNITQEQCQALWDDTNPLSLTGFDYQTNPIWFNALDGDIASRQLL
ncbi:MAG: hypothetical protein ACFFHV_24095, partial [Promethearchaeota archaeon]